MSEHSSLKEFEIPELLQMADSCEKYMYYDSGSQDEKKILFLQLCQPLICSSNQTTGSAMGNSQQL